MKKIIIFITFIFLISHPMLSQHPIYLAGGSQLGFWDSQTDKMLAVPFLVHADRQLSKHFFLGAGYSWNMYAYSFSFYRPFGQVRQNYRLRGYYYFNDDPNDRIAGYVGGSIGVSQWYGFPGRPGFRTLYLPSLQCLAGVKIRITDLFFSQTEISIGAPYLVQTSLGIKF